MIDERTYERFMAKVCPEPNTGCWLWMGACAHRGYGAFSHGKQIGAHVFSYLYHKGEIPDGHVVHHRCNVTCCVNPDHLEAVTHARNIRISADQRREPGKPSYREYLAMQPAKPMSRAELVQEAENFMSEFGIGEHRFGILAANNGRLVERLRSGGRVWPETEERVRDYMAERRKSARRNKPERAECAA